MLTVTFYLLLLLFVCVCLFLILVILLQAGKGGGLSSLAGGGGMMGEQMGSTSSEKTMNRATTICAFAFVSLLIILNLIGPAAVRKPSLTDDLPDAQLPAVSAVPVDVAPGADSALLGAVDDDAGAAPVLDIVDGAQTQESGSSPDQGVAAPAPAPIPAPAGVPAPPEAETEPQPAPPEALPAAGETAPSNP